MLDIEQFSIAAWCTPHAVMWNRQKKRGILYRGHAQVWNPERFLDTEVRRERVIDQGSSRGYTFGT